MSNQIDSLVMCVDDQFTDGDPACPDKTVVSFISKSGDAVCVMEFYSDQECDEIYTAVLRYAKRLGVEKTHKSNAIIITTHNLFINAPSLRGRFEWVVSC